MNYGGFWVRFLAYLVDSLIVAIGFGALLALLGFMGLELYGQELVFFVACLVYWAGMHSSARQATFGKALVGLKVRGQNGERVSFGRALAREVAKVISALTFLLGFIIAGSTRRKQALHDFIATTVVVRTQPGRVGLALALGLVTLVAPFVAAFMFGGALVGGLTAELTVLANQAVQAQAVQAPKPPAPAAVKPPAQAAAPLVKPVPVAAPAAPAQPVAIPAAAPVVLAQAKPEPAPQAQPKPVAREPRAPPAPREEAAPREAPPPAPIQTPAAAPAAPGPKFNDLMTAVLYRDAKAVEELLALGKWPDKPDSRGVTPLQLAAMQGDAPIAQALLKAGANPNYPGPGGETALSIARERKDDRMLGLLREYGGR